MAEVVLRERDLRHLGEVLAGVVPHDPDGLLPSPLRAALERLVPCGWVGVWEPDGESSRRLRLLELHQGALGCSPPDCLTAQERRVLRLVATGRSNQQVAQELSVAASTVRKHLEHAYLKLGVTSRSAAVAVAFPHGVASLDGADQPLSSSSVSPVGPPWSDSSSSSMISWRGT